MLVNWKTKAQIVQGDCLYSYKDIYELVNARKDLLQKCGVERNDRVVVMVKKDVNSLINILAIDCIEAVFIPIDIENDESLIRDIANENCAWVLNKYGENEIISEYRDKNGTFSNNDIEYIIYTSGSTGKRKGVQITWKNLKNYLDWFVDSFCITPEDSTYISTSIAYDLSYTGLFTALYVGATIYFPKDGEAFSVEDLEEKITCCNLTYLKITPAIVKMLVNRGKISAEDSKLRLIISGGDKINPEDIEKLHSLIGDKTAFVNHYGPTETTIGCCCKRIDFLNGWEEYKKNPTIGVPIRNVSIHIIDSNNDEIREAFQIGELFISGSCVGIGYVDGDSRGYRDGGYYSGDLGYFDDKNEIVLCGRKSNTIKLNGYRTSIEEIQKYCDEIPFWTESVVCFDDDCGYIKVFYQSNEVIDRYEIVRAVSHVFPKYLKPHYFFRVQEVPCTKNGKIDFSMLKKLRRGNTSQKDVYDLFDTICPLGDCSFYDVRTCSFSDLGVDSLTLLSMIAEAESKFEIAIPLQISKFDTVEKLAEYIKQLTDEKKRVIKNELVRMVEVNKISDLIHFCNNREREYLENRVGEYNMRSIQKLYCIQKNQIDNALHCSIVLSDERVIDNLAGFIKNHNCFHSLFDYENMKQYDVSLGYVSIPHIEVESISEYGEYVDWVMDYLFSRPMIPYVFILVNNKTNRYLDCYYNHFAILNRDMEYLETIELDFSEIPLDAQEPQLLSCFKNDCSEIVQMFENWVKASRNPAMYSFLQKGKKGITCDVLSVEFSKMFTEKQLIVAIAYCVGKYIGVSKIPVLLYKDARHKYVKQKLGDQSDYWFFVVDVNQEIQDVIDNISEWMEKYEQLNVAVIDILDKNGMLDLIYSNCITVNIVAEYPKNTDMFQQEIENLYLSRKKKNRAGVGVFSSTDVAHKNCRVNLGMNFKCDSFAEYCRDNLPALLHDIS